MLRIEQFVMAYGTEQDRLRALLPEEFVSLRPVLRFNAEIRNDRTAYLEFNTAAERNSVHGVSLGKTLPTCRNLCARSIPGCPSRRKMPPSFPAPLSSARMSWNLSDKTNEKPPGRAAFSFSRFDMLHRLFLCQSCGRARLPELGSDLHHIPLFLPSS